MTNPDAQQQQDEEREQEGAVLIPEWGHPRRIAGEGYAAIYKVLCEKLQELDGAIEDDRWRVYEGRPRRLNEDWHKFRDTLSEAVCEMDDRKGSVLIAFPPESAHLATIHGREQEEPETRKEDNDGDESSNEDRGAGSVRRGASGGGRDGLLQGEAGAGGLDRGTAGEHGRSGVGAGEGEAHTTRADRGLSGDRDAGAAVGGRRGEADAGSGEIDPARTSSPAERDPDWCHRFVPTPRLPSPALEPRFVPWNPDRPNGPGWVEDERGCHVWTGARAMVAALRKLEDPREKKP